MSATGMRNICTGFLVFVLFSSKPSALYAVSLVDWKRPSQQCFDEDVKIWAKMVQLRAGSLPEEGVNEVSVPDSMQSDMEDDEKEHDAIHSDAKCTDDIDSANAVESRSEAIDWRLAGKEAHDRGDFELASELFQKAAESLQGDSETPPLEEYATLRLHQALCYLKSENYNECLATCSEILDGNFLYSSAVKARAYHRRAKAKLALEDASGALQDARSAAFLGDRKAVALYGRLMRGTSSSSNTESSIDELFSHPSSSTSSLFESLMSKSHLNGESETGINPAALLFGAKGRDFINPDRGNVAGSGLAKSVINSLSKRLDDENTRISISTFLQKTDKTQLQHYASMAGMDVPETYLDRIENICHRITPKTVKRAVTTTRFVIYVVRIVRRVYKLAQKYKSLFLALALLQWTKSAILRPIPLDRVAAKRQAKDALRDAMKGNRAGPKLPR